MCILLHIQHWHFPQPSHTWPLVPTLSPGKASFPDNSVIKKKSIHHYTSPNNITKKKIEISQETTAIENVRRILSIFSTMRDYPWLIVAVQKNPFQILPCKNFRSSWEKKGPENWIFNIKNQERTWLIWFDNVLVTNQDVLGWPKCMANQIPRCEMGFKRFFSPDDSYQYHHHGDMSHHLWSLTFGGDCSAGSQNW